MAQISYEKADAYIEGLIMAAAAKEEHPARKELEQLIRKNKGLLIGAKALAHYTKPRFTEDTDYLVDGKTFQRVRTWFRDHAGELSFHDGGEAITCETLAVDVVDARHHSVLLEVTRREAILPSAEALAAIKYCSIINPARDRRDQDAVDFRSLVKLPEFDVSKCLDFFVDRFQSLRPEVQAAIERIQRGDVGITI